MFNRKLPAYTLMEVTVAMLISAIVIGITYTAYTIVSNSYASYKIKNDEMSTLLRCDELLHKDFLNADTIYCDSKNDIIFEIDTQSVIYNIDTNFVIRKAGIIDTIDVKVIDRFCLFEGVAVPADNPTSASTQLLDELQLIIQFHGKAMPFNYRKLYSSANLINRLTNAIN